MQAISIELQLLLILKFLYLSNSYRIEPLEHSDLVYIFPGHNHSHSIVDMNPIHQIAASYSEQVIGLRFGDTFTPTTIYVHGNVSGNSSRSCITWIYQSPEFLPKDQPNLRLDDKVYYFDNSSEAGPNLFEVYGIKNKSIVQEVLTTIESKLRRRRNFGQALLDVAHVHESTRRTTSGYETLTATDDWGPDALSYQLLGYMQDFLNFSVQFKNSSTWVYARSPTEPSMADLVNRSEVDLGLSNTGLWASADFGFLFITGIYTEVYVYYHPLSGSYSRKGFAGVVRPEVWLCFLASALAITIISPFFFQWDMQNSFSWMIALLTQRGSCEPESTFTTSPKILIFVTSSLSLLFFVSLSAILISNLSIKIEISEIEGLASRGYSFGVLENSILDNSFKFDWISDTSPLKSMRSTHYATIASEKEAAQRVVTTPKFAYISHQLIFMSHREFMEEIDACKNIKVFTLNAEKRWGSAFVRRGSEFTDHFNFARLRMKEVGITDRHLNVGERDREYISETCVSQTPSPTTVIHFQDVSQLFYVYFTGLLAGAVIFMYESRKFLTKLH